MVSVVDRRVRTRQPKGPVAVGQSNPLARGLIALFNPNSATEVVTGKPWTVLGSPTSDVSLADVGKKTNGSTDALYVSIGTKVLTKWTLFAVQKSNNVAADTRSLSLGNSGDNTQLVMLNASAITASKLRLFARDDAGLNSSVDTTADFYDGALHTIVLTCDGASLTAYRDGGIVEISNFSFGSFTVDQFCVGALQRGATQSYWSGSTYAAGAFNRALPAHEVARLIANPSQLFADARQDTWIAAAGSGAYTPSQTEVITLADSASQIAALSTSSSEALTLSDSSSVVAAIVSAITEAMGLAGAQDAVVSMAAGISEAMGLSDSAGNIANFSASIAEASTFSSSTTNIAALSAASTEPMALADTSSAGAAGDYAATVSEGMTLSDTSSNAATLSAAIAESLGLADPASNIAALSASASEAMTLIGSQSASAAGDYAASATESLSPADASSNVAALLSAISEAMSLADTGAASSPWNYSASIAESLALADAATVQAAMTAVMVEALSLSDNAAAPWALYVAIVQSLTLDDSLSHILNAIVTESAWWAYSVAPNNLAFSVAPDDLTFSVGAAQTAYSITR